MVQAVDMYYFLMDKHQAGKKHVNPTYKNLCQQVSFDILSELRIAFPANSG